MNINMNIDTYGTTNSRNRADVDITSANHSNSNMCIHPNTSNDNKCNNNNIDSNHDRAEAPPRGQRRGGPRALSIITNVCCIMCMVIIIIIMFFYYW